MHFSVKRLGNLKYAELIASLYTQWMNCHTLNPSDEWNSKSIFYKCLGRDPSTPYTALNCNLCCWLTALLKTPTLTYSLPTPTTQPNPQLHTHTNRSSEREQKRQPLSLISSHPGLFVSTWSLPVISQLRCKLFNHAHVWNCLNTPDTTPRKALSCAERRADTLSENRTLGVNE